MFGNAPFQLGAEVAEQAINRSCGHVAILKSPYDLQ